jgi:hypothetical protein
MYFSLIPVLAGYSYLEANYMLFVSTVYRIQHWIRCIEITIDYILYFRSGIAYLALQLGYGLNDQGVGV